jgi:C-terminal processing protease CtpA/Prc
MIQLNSNTTSRFFFLFTLFLVLFCKKAHAQEKISPEIKYKEAGLVWGLLKYHHPEISNGKYDWDLEFVILFDKLDAVENQEEMNDLLLAFISKFKTNNLEIKKINKERLFVKNADYGWIDNKIFGEKLTNALLKIKENGNINNYYASTDKLAKMLSFKNETGFKDFNYSIKSHRLLLLYSFWNVIQYWNINKYLMDEKWTNCLDSMTKAFINCKTNVEFEILKSKLISKLNDSHSYYLSSAVNDSLFKYGPVFSVKAINDSLLINSIYNKSLAKNDGIELGDIIVKINNKNISTCLNEKIAPILSVSNLSFLKKFSTWLFLKESDSINVDIIKKNGIRLNQYVHLYSKYDDEQPVYLGTEKKHTWIFIKPDIAYIDLDQITKKELKIAFKQITNTKGLILDLRNYPKNISNEDLAEFLYPKKKEFIKVLFPLENHPSFGEYDGEAPLKQIANPFKSGINNPDYYKGKVLLLVNKRTQSKAEFIGMTIQQSPNCTTIGEQTAGSVMNIVSYMLPDKTEVNFTGLGAFYPNGEEVQRKGLNIDYYVRETAKNYDPELYIKDAIRIIEGKN